MAGDVEEAVVGTGAVEGPGDGEFVVGGVGVEEGCEVDDGEGGCGGGGGSCGDCLGGGHGDGWEWEGI